MVLLTPIRWWCGCHRWVSRVWVLTFPFPRSPCTQLVDKYVHQTHARTHNQYKLEVVDVFEIEREGERAVFQDVGNRSGNNRSINQSNDIT